MKWLGVGFPAPMPIKSKRKTTPKQDKAVDKGASDLADSSGDESTLSPAALALYATFETGFLAACADGVLDQTEYDVLCQSFLTWTGADIPEDKMAELVQVFIGAREAQGAQPRIEAAAGFLDEDQRRDAFDFAAAIAISSEGTSEDEIVGLQFIAKAFGIDDDEARERWIAIGEQLSDDDDEDDEDDGEEEEEEK